MEKLFGRELIIFILSLVVLSFPTTGQSDWVKDSLEVKRLHQEANDAFWNNPDNEKHRESHRQMLELSQKMLKQHYDSVIFFHNAYARQGIGVSYRLNGENERALVYLDSSISLMVEKFGPGYFPLQESYVTKAGIYANKGDYDRALDAYERHRYVVGQNRERKDYRMHLSNYHHGVALIYEKMGKADLAAQHYERAALLMIQSGREVSAIRDLDPQGVFFLRTQQYDKAESVFDTIYNIVQRNIPNYPVPNLYANLRKATVYIFSGQDSLAGIFLEKSFPLPAPGTIGGRQHLTIADALELMGDAYFERGNYSEAVRLWKEKQGLIEHFHGPKYLWSIEVQRKINEAWLMQHKLDSAFTDIRAGIQKFETVFNFDKPKFETLKSHTGAGIVLPSFLGQYGKALTLQYNRTKDPQLLKKGMEYHSLAARLIGALRRDFFTAGSKQILISRAIELYEGAVETALQLYEATNDPQHLETAFSFAEKSKSVLLLESVQGSKAQSFSGVPQPLLDREKDLKIDIAFYGKRVYDEQNKKQPDVDKINRWETRLLDLRNVYDSVLTVFREDYPDYYDLKYNIRYATVAEIRDYLAPDEHRERSACIEYFWGKENLYAFLITKDKVNCIRKSLSEEMEGHLQSFTQLLSRPDLGDAANYSDHAGYLYDYLLRDVLEGTEVEHLIIIPDGRLGYLPFQVLIDNRQLEGVEDFRKLPYVINNYEVRYEYSSTLLLAEHTPKAQRGGFLGFAPQYGDGTEGVSVRSADADELSSVDGGFAEMKLLPLKFTRSEVEEVSRLLTGSARTGTSATESSFKSEAPNQKILHLAMHAHTNDENPLYSRLVFEQNTEEEEDGLLHAYELYNMDLQAELAVLSACETGVGELKHGEGIMSLSRAFKYAGCPNIVMSLWQADDASTKDIMVHFYRNLKEGMGKAEALRKAKKAYLAQAGIDKSHPYYWATFVLAGDGEPVGVE